MERGIEWHVKGSFGLSRGDEGDASGRPERCAPAADHLTPAAADV